MKAKCSCFLENVLACNRALSTLQIMQAATLMAELKEAWDKIEANGGRTCIDVLVRSPEASN